MAKKTQIVCQHLENISRAVLEEHQTIIRQYIRGRHGVYALYCRDKLYYVGLASNLRTRLKQHLYDKHSNKWDRFSVYLTIDNKAIKELETLMLRILNPEGNSMGGRFVRSQNLATQFSKEIRSNQRDRLYDLMGKQRRSSKQEKLSLKKLQEGNGKQPPLAKYIRGSMKLRAKHLGKSYRGSIRKDGRVRYDGAVYESPSAAAAAAVGRGSYNGWQFWRYERAPGDWVRLSKLRE